MARAGLTPDRVVDAGLDLADESGLVSVTLSALARRLGVQVPSLYAHLAGADDLASRLTAAALDDLADQVGEAIAGRARGEALRAMAAAYRDFARRHPGRWAATRVTGSGPTTGPTTGPTVEVLAAGRRHADLARALLRGYELAEPAATHAVRLIGSVVMGWVDAEQAESFAHSEPDAEESWTWTLDVLDDALDRAGR